MILVLYIKETRLLAIEMNKVENGRSPVVFSEIFSIRHQKRLNLRQNLDFAVPSIKSFSHGFESLLYLGPKIWESIPSSVREKDSLKKFKDEIKQ